MAKIVDKFMNFMQLSYEDDDYDDNYDQQPAKKESKPKASEKKVVDKKVVEKKAEDQKSESGSIFGGMKKEPVKTVKNNGRNITKFDADNVQTMKKESRMTMQTEKKVDNGQKSPRVSVVRGGGSKVEAAIVSIRPKDDGSKIEIADRLLEGKTVLINMEGLEVDTMQRIVDFTAGVCYAIRGDMRFPSKYTIIAAPEDVELSGNYEDSQDKRSGVTF